MWQELPQRLKPQGWQAVYAGLKPCSTRWLDKVFKIAAGHRFKRCWYIRARNKGFGRSLEGLFETLL